MKRHSVCVLGGSGFVGRHLVSQLAAAGHRIRVPTRHRERHRDLLVLPTVNVVEANIHDSAALNQVLAGCDVVINLVAILNETRREQFRAVHVELVRALGLAAQQQGVARLLHMSALNADAKQGASRYLRSKGEGEDLAHSFASAGLHVTSFRPSVIYGPDDHFFNKFAALLKLPGPLPLPCPDARFAPVIVGDVARAIESVLDNYETMQVEAACRGPFPAVLGFRPEPVEAVVPYYLGQRDQHAFFDAVRQEARHHYCSRRGGVRCCGKRRKTASAARRRRCNSIRSAVQYGTNCSVCRWWTGTGW